MMKNVFFNIVQIIIGLSSGIVIGAAFVALLIVLGVIQRLLQMINFRVLMFTFVSALVLGVIFGTFLSFTTAHFHTPIILLFVWGAIHGMFNGMIAAALVEILNVFPLLSRRFRLDNYILVLLTAIVLGKIFGSLFQWMYLMK